MGFPIHCQGENIVGTLQLNLQWWCVWGVVVDSKQNLFSRLKPLQNVVLNDGSLVRYPTPWKTFQEVGTWDVHPPLVVILLNLNATKSHGFQSRFTNKKKRKRANWHPSDGPFLMDSKHLPMNQAMPAGALVKTPYGNSFLSNQYLQHVFDEL